MSERRALLAVPVSYQEQIDGILTAIENLQTQINNLTTVVNNQQTTINNLIVTDEDLQTQIDNLTVQVNGLLPIQEDFEFQLDLANAAPSQISVSVTAYKTADQVTIRINDPIQMPSVVDINAAAILTPPPAFVSSIYAPTAKTTYSAWIASSILWGVSFDTENEGPLTLTNTALWNWNPMTNTWYLHVPVNSPYSPVFQIAPDPLNFRPIVGAEPTAASGLLAKEDSTFVYLV